MSKVCASCRVVDMSPTVSSYLCFRYHIIITTLCTPRRSPIAFDFNAWLNWRYRAKIGEREDKMNNPIKWYYWNRISALWTLRLENEHFSLHNLSHSETLLIAQLAAGAYLEVGSRLYTRHPWPSTASVKRHIIKLCCVEYYVRPTVSKYYTDKHSRKFQEKGANKN